MNYEQEISSVDNYFSNPALFNRIQNMLIQSHVKITKKH